MTGKEEVKEDILMDEPRSSKTWIILAVIGLVALFLVMYFVFFSGKSRDEATAKIRQMQNLTRKIGKLEKDVKGKQDEILKLMESYKEETGKTFEGINFMNLNKREKALLQHKIQTEQKTSIKSLLNDILDRNDEINKLKERIIKIEALLPRPHVVTKGENHFQIAMDFLINSKGIDKKKAMKIVEKTGLAEELVTGFKVWNFYMDGEYGSSVTQGSAKVSPNQVRRMAKKEIIDARDLAIAQRDQLAEEIKILEEKRSRIFEQLDLLNKEKENLISEIDALQANNQQMVREMNSIHYSMDTNKKLVEKKILRTGFLSSAKLQNFNPADFTSSVDLRDKQSISILASALNLKKIRKVVIYPKFFKIGRDYRVNLSKDKNMAVLNLIDTEKFKGARVFIAVR